MILYFIGPLRRIHGLSIHVTQLMYPVTGCVKTTGQWWEHRSQLAVLLLREEARERLRYIAFTCFVKGLGAPAAPVMSLTLVGGQ